MTSLLGRCLPPILACAPMVAAVYGARRAWSGLGAPPLVGLPLEILVGALAFVGGAFVLAPGITREFLAVVAAARKRRRRA